jgi:signal transduction histidine kinase
MNPIKRILNKFSIKQKLIALSMVTSTIATIITCSGFIAFNVFEERDDLVDEIRLVSRIFAEELAEYVVEGNANAILKSLEALKTRESLIQTCVYTNNEESSFIQFIRDPIRGRPCDEISKVKGKFEFRNDSLSGSHLIVTSYISHNNYKIGSIVMICNLDRIHERIEHGIITALGLFIFILIISYMISRSLQHTISGPILHLADVSYIVRDGSYHVRAKHYADDELGILTDAYNNMLKEIQNSKENLEEKVVERTRDLEKMMQIKSQFLSNMSHEIRTPIHGIMNYVDFLVQDWEVLDRDQKYSFVKKLHHNSGRLLSLINNLLDLSKLDAGKMEFFMKKENMTIMVQDAIQECEALYENRKDISIEFMYDQEASYIASLDKERISQVIRNLFSNAIKFTPKGMVTLSLKLVKFKKENGNKSQGIEFSIKDEGVGIPTEELLYIFDKFNQSAKTKTGAGGTGLGLTISREIIKAHQGIIWAVNNSNNIGSTFTFIIPINQQKHKIIKEDHA